VIQPSACQDEIGNGPVVLEGERSFDHQQNQISQKPNQYRVHLLLPLFSGSYVEYDGNNEENNWWNDHPEFCPERHLVPPFEVRAL
jgi:hypothetical protein